MFCMGLMWTAELSRVVDMDLLAFLEMLDVVSASSSRASPFAKGRSTGLKDRLPSGVVGAVDASKRTISSESTTEGGIVAMLEARAGGETATATRSEETGVPEGQEEANRRGNPKFRKFIYRRFHVRERNAGER